MMNDITFQQLADETLEKIESLLENLQDDLDFEFETPSEGIIELTFENKTKIIINKHNPMKEIWIASKSGGFHFQYDDVKKQWFSQRDQLELFESLNANIIKQAQ